jgi:hypothetical protein
VHLGGFKVTEHFELSQQLDWQFGGFGAHEYLANEPAARRFL